MKSSTVMVAIMAMACFTFIGSLAYGDDQAAELLQAAAAGDANLVKQLLDKGANIEATSKEGATPLMWAAMYGHPEVVRVLLERGAKVNARTPAGITALEGAASQGNPAVIRLLLQAGADPNAADKQGVTPLIVAQSRGHADVVALLQGVPGKPVAPTTPGAPAGMEATVTRVDQPEQCLRVRQGPGTNYAKVGCAAHGAKLSLTGVVKNNWAEVRTPVAGWVTASQIDAPGLFPAKQAAAGEQTERSAVRGQAVESYSFRDRTTESAERDIENLRRETEEAEMALPIGPGVIIGIGRGGFGIGIGIGQ